MIADDPLGDPEPEVVQLAESGTGAWAPVPSAEAVVDRDGLTTVQREYLEWLLDPNHTGNKKEWARAHDVNEGTPRTWELKQTFIDARNQRLNELNINPMRVQLIIDALFAKASAGDVQAAKLVLDYLNKINPVRPQVEDRAVSEMTDEELNQKLEELRR